MLINADIKTPHVKFIDYTGEYPNLCSGILTLEINGKEVKFDSKRGEKFWTSGGHFDSSWCVCQGEWTIDVECIPKEYKKYAQEIDIVFNKNIPLGCCGGCE